MAHELTVRDSGVVEMFSAGSEPVWHRLGRRTGKAVTSEQAMELAGLDWTVAERSLGLIRPDGTATPLPAHKAVIREDNGLVLGVVGRRYTPLQNVDAFEWLDAIIGERLAIYETAGSISGGKVVWMMVRLPDELRVGRTEDVTLPYVLVCNSHDGSRALRILNCAVRVVCSNTLTLGLSRGEGSGLAIRHTASIHEKVEQARRALGIATKRYRQMQQQMDRLSQRRLTADEVKEYFLRIWPDNPHVDDTSRTEAVRQQLLENFTGPAQRIAGIEQSAWAAFNAVSQYTDWQRPTRGRTDEQRLNNRLASMWLGDSANVKRRAWNEALALLN